MPQKPLDKRDPRRSRDNMWKAMMELGTFSVKDISYKTMLHTGTISAYLIGLEAAGYVTVEREQIRPNQTKNTYTIVKRQLETPRVKKDGSEISLGRGTENMWRSMRMIGTFSPADLAAAASTSDAEIKLTTAKDYIKHLLRAGYLAIVSESSPGTQANYRIIKSKISGPFPPQIQRVKQVYDPNLQKVVWPAVEELS
jgi:hypothetical protein